MQPRRGDPQGDPERRSRTSVYRGRVSIPVFGSACGPARRHPGGRFGQFRPSVRSSMRKKVTFDHPIFTRWPAQNPDRLQLFSAPTPNGVKVGIMLEETSLAYEPHRIDIMADESPFTRSTPTARFPQSTTPKGRAARRSRCSNRARSSSILPTRRDNLSRPIRTPATKQSSG
jgi:hypothetical protein